MFYKIRYSTLINAVMKYLKFCSSGLKLHSITYKFTKSHTPSQVFSKNFTTIAESDIEKCIKMAACGDNFILEIFMNGCFSKAAAIFILVF